MRLGLGLSLASVGGIAPFTPANLALSGYWRASFAGAPWAATASAGVSGTTGALTVVGATPTTGTAVNGFTPAVFASGKALTNTADASTLWAAGAGTIFALFKAASADTATGNKYDDPALLHDSSVRFTMNFSSAGIGGTMVDGVDYQQAITPCSTGAWHLAMVRFSWNGSSGTIGVTLDSAAEVTHAIAGNLVRDGTDIFVGEYQPGSLRFDGSILELGTAAYKVTDADYAQIKSYVNTRYALSL